MIKYVFNEKYKDLVLKTGPTGLSELRGGGRRPGGRTLLFLYKKRKKYFFLDIDGKRIRSHVVILL